MTHKDKRHGHYVDTQCELGSEYFKDHDREGRGIAKTEEELRDAYKRREDATGIRGIVNPDGGMPSAEWMHEQRVRNQDRQRAERKAIEERRAETAARIARYRR